MAEMERHLELLAEIRHNLACKRQHGLLQRIPRIGFLDQTDEVEAQAALAEIRNEVHDCQLCPLARIRLDRAMAEAVKRVGRDRVDRAATIGRARDPDFDERVCYERFAKAVPGGGNHKARVMIVGEAPGYYEETLNDPTDGRFGVPFVGPSGRLLDRMLEYAGLSREEVFVANALKCRPPENRDPAADEMNACVDGIVRNGEQRGGYLHRQIAAVLPWLIVAAGRHAARAVLGDDASVAAARGKLHVYPRSIELGLSEKTPIQVLVTYHPAAMLHGSSPTLRGTVAEEDLALIRAMVREARQRLETR